MNSPRIKAYVLMIIVTLIWALAEPVIKFTLGAIPPLLFLTYRFAVSSILAIILFAISGIKLPKDKKTLFEFFIYVALSIVSLVFLFFGLKDTTVLDASIISLSAPLVTSAAGVYLLKEHVTRREKIGMTIALIGTAIAVAQPLIQSEGAVRLSGNVLIVFYLLAGSLAAVYAKKLMRAGVEPLTLTNVFFIVGLMALLPFALSRYNLGDLVQIRLPYHLGVLFMAIFSGSLAYYLSNKAQKTIEISEASVFSYLYPVIAAPLAVLWLGEAITPVFIIGALVIIIGVAVAEIKKKPKLTS